MTTISNEKLQEIIELEKQATPVEWFVGDNTVKTIYEGDYSILAYVEDRRTKVLGQMNANFREEARNDAALIVALRNAAASMAQELIELREENTKVKQDIEAYNHDLVLAKYAAEVDIAQAENTRLREALAFAPGARWRSMSGEMVEWTGIEMQKLTPN